MGHPEFRASVLRVVQAYHRWEVGRTLNHTGAEGEKKVFVGQMADDKALKMASSVVSEGFLFAVGSALIYFEYERGRRRDAAKQEKETAFRQQLLLQQAVTTRNLEALEARLVALERLVEERRPPPPRRGVFGRGPRIG